MESLCAPLCTDRPSRLVVTYCNSVRHVRRFTSRESGHKVSVEQKWFNEWRKKEKGLIRKWFAHSALRPVQSMCRQVDWLNWHNETKSTKQGQSILEISPKTRSLAYSLLIWIYNWWVQKLLIYLISRDASDEIRRKSSRWLLPRAWNTCSSWQIGGALKCRQMCQIWRPRIESTWLVCRWWILPALPELIQQTY